MVAIMHARGHEIDLAPVQRLIDCIIAAWRPEQIWLFGSRSRGEASTTSDWDLFAVVPDALSDAELGPLVSWRLRKQSATRGDVLPCRISEFAEDRDTPNTMAYEVAREGILLYER